jgi:glycosyltransferase involved in cell wall biosynthesis
MHIAIDCRLMHYRKAGITQYTRRLLRAMAALGAADVRLTALLDRRDVDTDWLPSGVVVQRTITPAHHRAEAFTLPLELAAGVARRRIDLVHFPDFIAVAGPFAKVITIHDLFFLKEKTVLDAASSGHYGQIGASVARARQIIAVSHAVAADVARLLPAAASKLAVVHEAADLYARSRTDAGAGLEPAPYVLFVGTFEPRKNISTLLRALALTSTDMRLVIVGEAGWVDNAPGQLAHELGVDDRITFAGRVDDAELDALYRGARALLLPSLDEGFGLTVLEAMSRGTPVLCSDVPALREVGAEAALYHAATDAAALAAQLSLLWRNSELRADLAQRGRARTAEFSWERAARETLIVYRRALA